MKSIQIKKCLRTGPVNHPLNPGESIAEGSYSDGSKHQSYFGQLRVKTLPGMEDLIQMRAAGFLEGFLTAGIISNQYTRGCCDGYVFSASFPYMIGVMISQTYSCASRE